MSTMQTQHRPKTWEDVLQMPDDGNRYEFIGGRLYVTAAPVTRHQRISKRPQAALMRILEDAGHGEVLSAPLLVQFPGTDDRVQPDLLFISEERRGIIGEKQVLGAPDLVVEILSPSTAHRDRGIKLDLYARSGVRQYWIVDPVEVVVDVWRFGDDPGHERLSGELPVRFGDERVGQIDLDQVFPSSRPPARSSPASRPSRPASPLPRPLHPCLHSPDRSDGSAGGVIGASRAMCFRLWRRAGPCAYPAAATPTGCAGTARRVRSRTSGSRSCRGEILQDSRSIVREAEDPHGAEAAGAWVGTGGWPA